MGRYLFTRRCNYFYVHDNVTTAFLHDDVTTAFNAFTSTFLYYFKEHFPGRLYPQEMFLVLIFTKCSYCTDSKLSFFCCYFCGCFLFLFLVFYKFLEPNRYFTLKINAHISDDCISANWSQASRLYGTDYSYCCVEVQSLIPEGLWVIQ
jgi:hypothetical protein